MPENPNRPDPDACWQPGHVVFDEWTIPLALVDNTGEPELHLRALGAQITDNILRRLAAQSVEKKA